MIPFSGVTAIGDLTNYPNTDLVLGNPTSVDFSKMILPPTLQNLGFENIVRFSMAQLSAAKWPALKELYSNLIDDRDFVNSSLSGIPGGFTFPKGVQTLIWGDNAFGSIPSGIPSSVQIMAFRGNYILDLVGLPTGLIKINFQGNSLKQVTNMDWSSATLVFPISNLTVNQETFDALDSLTEWKNDKTNYYGFLASKGIYTSSSSCSAINGQMKSLWSGKTSYTMNVCVTGANIFFVIINSNVYKTK
ncbi:hypothetical protein THRCLA_22471 [Thraustotheca clavata]|uniref:Uncharacterized protein n=1 Tax=Thraustotheca clavata TaxID=74557 RepID=A0A1V9Z022_9STRA|nr:hypothetical protein THRCLA_22471 [Thraustotheca clavata]